MTITTVEQANEIEMSWILDNVNLDKARQAFHRQPRPNQMTRQQFEMPALGTWRIDPWGELSVLVAIPLEQFQPGEGDWEIALRYPETQLYIEWQRQGFEPPPLDVVSTDKGNLRSLNRRRWLAAREAGVRALKCWYSPTHPEHCASPKWSIEV